MRKLTVNANRQVAFRNMAKCFKETLDAAGVRDVPLVGNDFSGKSSRKISSTGNSEKKDAPVSSTSAGRQKETVDMNDDEVKALRKELAETKERLRAEILAEKELEFSDSLAKPIIEQFQKDNPRLFSDVEMVANHIDHVVKLAGIDHVGLGSDFDGVGDSLPVGLKDVSQFPNLVKVLLQRGYSEEDIAKVCYKNVFRVWNEVERVAASM